jgi:hypothetical protein
MKHILQQEPSDLTSLASEFVNVQHPVVWPLGILACAEWETQSVRFVYQRAPLNDKVLPYLLNSGVS